MFAFVRGAAFISIAVTSVRLVTAQQALSSREHSNLYDDQRSLSSAPPPMTNDGMALAPDNDGGKDDSFGAQVVLKDQPRLRSFVISGDSSVIYISNAALTRQSTVDDVFVVGNVAATWSHPLSNQFGIQIGAHASLFRYERNSVLDFNNLGAGLGLSWTSVRWPGVDAFVRYDFVELLKREGEELLQDHEFTIGAEKIIGLSRAQAITFGVSASLGITSPSEAARNQAFGFIGYHLQISRSFGADVVYRAGGYFYQDHGRSDFNQGLSGSFRYRVSNWMDAMAFLSLGDNHSSQSVFDYQVFSAGGGIGVFIRF